MAYFSCRLRIPIVGNFVRRTLTMSRQLRAEEAIEEIKQKNPYFEKYSHKIAALQQTSPEEFLEKVENVTKKSVKSKNESTRNYSELMRPKESLKESKKSGFSEKKLSDIMKIDLIAGKSVEEIKEIWCEYHKEKDVISAVVPTEHFDKLMEIGKKYPIFLLPLPRSEGYEFIMLQFAANTVHFTPLLCYQIHNENAPECLNIVHYTEFRDKGIVLMRGEYDRQVINGKEAQCLANQLQLYYCKNDQSKISLMEKFTYQPDSFKHMDLIKGFENIELK